MSRLPHRSGLAALLGLLLVFGACGGAEETPETEPTEAAATATAAVTGSVEASDQSSDGTSLKVASVTITGGNGFIAVHRDVNNTPGPVVGHSELLKAGTTKDVEIKLDETVQTGAFWPMLHADSNANGKYEFPTQGLDAPVKVGNVVVMKKITLTVT